MMTNLYAYYYDSQNDLYTIRGLTPGEVEFEPRALSNIPSDLLDTIKREYLALTGKKEANLKISISFSKNKFYAIVDFNGRLFDYDQIMTIISGTKLDKTDNKRNGVIRRLIMKKPK